MARRFEKPQRVDSGDSMGLGVWTGAPRAMSLAHSHGDLEWNLVLAGSMRYFIAGRFATVSAGQLGVFWGGIPHRLLECGSKSRVAWVTLPLAWFMQWELNREFTARLLRGEMLLTPGEIPGDQQLLLRWEADLKHRERRARDDGETLRVVMLEMEARLRRLARSLAAKSAKARAPAIVHAGGGAVERMTRFMSEQYQKPLSVTKIASAADLHPNYAMQLFRARCGMSLWEYLIRLRLSHAQRLLLMTDEKVTRIALESGFGSATRFYSAFSRVVGQTPRRYRLSQRGGL